MFLWLMQQAEPEMRPFVSPPEWWEVLLANQWTIAGLHIVGFFGLALVINFLLGRIVQWLVGKTTASTDEHIIGILHKPVFVSIMLAGVWFAMDSLTLEESVTLVLGGVVQTLAILIWSRVGTRIISTTLDSASKAQNKFRWIQPTTIPLLSTIAKIALYGLSIYFVLLSWGIDPAAWLAAAGVIGIAVGFGAKDTVANLFGGITVQMDKPYKIGDYIRIDTGERGMVIRVGLRSTRIRTRDNEEVTIPNSVIANAKIVNESGGPTKDRRIRVRVGVAYGTDLENAAQVIEQAIREHDKHLVLNNPLRPLRVHAAEFGQSAIIFEIKVSMKDPEFRGRATNDVVQSVYKALNENGIEIPFEQRVLHFAESSLQRLAGANASEELHNSSSKTQ